MQKIFAALAAGAIIGTAAQAQAAFDWANPTMSVVVTTQNILDNTGHTAAASNDLDLRTVAVDATTGNLVIYTGNDGAATAGELTSIDISGSTPSFTTLATEAELITALGGTAGEAVASNTIRVDSNGDVYVGTFGDSDSQIVRVQPGSPSTLNSVITNEGLTTFDFINSGNDFAVGQINNFGSFSNDFVSYPKTGGSSTVIANQTTVTGASGAPEAGIVAFGVLSNGDYITWDESFREGSDSFLSITSAGAVSVAAAAADFNPSAGASGAVEDVRTDSTDNTFAWQEFGSDNGLFVFPAPFSSSTAVYIDEADIESTLSLGSDVESATGGLAVYEPDASTRRLYLACENNDVIIELEWVDSANVNSWELYSH